MQTLVQRQTSEVLSWSAFGSICPHGARDAAAERRYLPTSDRFCVLNAVTTGNAGLRRQWQNCETI